MAIGTRASAAPPVAASPAFILAAAPGPRFACSARTSAVPLKTTVPGFGAATL